MKNLSLILPKQHECHRPSNHGLSSMILSKYQREKRKAWESLNFCVSCSKTWDPMAGVSVLFNVLASAWSRESPRREGGGRRWRKRKAERWMSDLTSETHWCLGRQCGQKADGSVLRREEAWREQGRDASAVSSQQLSWEEEGASDEERQAYGWKVIF